MASLTHRWMDLESTLMADPAWAALSREERRFTPAQVRLNAIDDLKEGAHDRQNLLLEQLVAAPTMDVSGAAAKLAIVMGVMIPEDYPHCYQLIEDVVSTLAPLICPHCRWPLGQTEATALIVRAAMTWNQHKQV